MKPIFFSTQADFRKWLDENHLKATELLVGFYKVGSGKPSMNWSQSVDEALCFGWIDGIRRSIDNDSYCIRFTPRRPTSIWSTVNINKVENLSKLGLMHTAGLVAFSKRKVEKSNIYSFESGAKELSENLKEIFRANKLAWEFFTKQAPSYQKATEHWIMAAKKEETRLNRLDKTIRESEKLKRLL